MYLLLSSKLCPICYNQFLIYLICNFFLSLIYYNHSFFLNYSSIPFAASSILEFGLVGLC